MASHSFRSFSLFWVEWVCIFVLLSSQHVFADEAKECPVGPLNLKPSDFNVVVTNGESRQWNLGPKGVRVSMTEELEQFSYDLHEACFMLSTEKEVKVLDVVLVGNCPVSLSFQLSHTKEQVESSLSLQRTYLMDSFGKLDADALTHHRLYIPGSVINTFQLQFTAVSTPCTINHLSLLYHNESVSFVSYLRDMNEAKKTALLLPIAEIPEEGGNYKQELAKQKWISNSWNEATVTTTDVKVDHPYKYHITMPPSSVLSTTVPLPEKEKQEVVTLKAQLSVKYCKEHVQSTESALLSAFVTAIQSNPQGEQLTTFLSMVSVYRELYHFIEEDCQETLFNMLPNYSRILVRVSVVAPQPVNLIKSGVCTGPADDDDSFHIFDMSLGRYGEPETILQPGGTPTSKESIPAWGIALLVVFSIIIIMVIPCSLLLCQWYRKTQGQQFRVLQPGYVDHDDMETMGANADLELEMAEH